jgi:hypothetical protein
MCPTEREPDLLAPPGECSIATIAIDLQDACKITEMGLRSLRLAIGSIDIGDHRRIVAAPGSIIAGIGPELAGLGPSASRVEHGGRCLVGEEPCRSSQPFQHMIAQRTQIPGRPANPVSQRRAIQLDTLPGINLGLPIQRQVICVLGDQHMGDQRLGRNTAFDNPCRRWSLDHCALA